MARSYFSTKKTCVLLACAISVIAH